MLNNTPFTSTLYKHCGAQMPLRQVLLCSKSIYRRAYIPLSRLQASIQSLQCYIIFIIRSVRGRGDIKHVYMYMYMWHDNYLCNIQATRPQGFAHVTCLCLSYYFIKHSVLWYLLFEKIVVYMVMFYGFYLNKTSNSTRISHVCRGSVCMRVILRKRGGGILVLN